MNSQTSIGRTVAIALGAALTVGVIVLAFLWPTVTSSVADIPLAVSGTSEQVAQVTDKLDDSAEGAFTFTTVDDRADAVALIEQRQVLGAIILGQQPEVLTTSAGSPIVSQLLAGVATQLAAAANAAAAAQGIQLPAPITVTVTDVVPLADTDARGTGIAAAAFPLTLGGMIGGVVISLVISGARRRLIAAPIYAAAAGLIGTAILQGWFGILQGDYWVNSLAMATAFLATAVTMIGLRSLLGTPGIAIGAAITLFVGNPISAATQPWQFLPQPWGQIGQWFVPGAASTLIRDLSYFPEANTVFPWLVLIGWIVAGTVLALVAHHREPGEVATDELAPDSRPIERELVPTA